jgi:hypothetical protein
MIAFGNASRGIIRYAAAADISPPEFYHFYLSPSVIGFIVAHYFFVFNIKITVRRNCAE